MWKVSKICRTMKWWWEKRRDIKYYFWDKLETINFNICINYLYRDKTFANCRSEFKQLIYYNIWLLAWRLREVGTIEITRFQSTPHAFDVEAGICVCRVYCPRGTRLFPDIPRLSLWPATVCCISSLAHVFVSCHRWFIGKSIAPKVNYSARSGKRTRRAGKRERERAVSSLASSRYWKPSRGDLVACTLQRLTHRGKVAACLLSTRKLQTLLAFIIIAESAINFILYTGICCLSRYR